MRKNYFYDSDIIFADYQTIFDVIIDVEKYPDFLKWCKKVQIIKSQDKYIEAELNVVFKNIKASYISNITYSDPNDKGEIFIKVESSQGAFKHLFNLWTITPQGKDKTKVSIKVEFEFKSSILNYLLKLFYKQAQNEIIRLFRCRINTVYNTKKK